MSEIIDGAATYSKRLWWLVLLRGLIAIVLGIFAFVAPVTLAKVFIIVFGIYALIDGIALVVYALRSRGRGEKWGWTLTEGIVSFVAGIVTFIWPVAAAAFAGLVLLWIAVFYSLALGVATLAAASVAASGTKGRGWAFTSGIINVVFAIWLFVLLLTNPAATFLGLIWVVGVYAVVFGIVLVVAAFAVRSAVKDALGSADTSAA